MVVGEHPRVTEALDDRALAALAWSALLKKAGGRSQRKGRDRLIHLAELIADLRRKSIREQAGEAHVTQTRTQLIKAVNEAAGALDALLATAPISYRTARAETNTLFGQAADLRDRLRAERKFLRDAPTSGDGVVDLVLNWEGRGGGPSRAQAVAIRASDFGLTYLDIARLESVMIVGIPDLPEHLQGLPVPERATRDAGLYLSADEPDGSELASDTLPEKWKLAFFRGGLAT